MDLGLRNKRALVIASSQGLGKAIAAELLKEGADVMLASRNKEKLAAVQKELTGLGGRVSFKTVDITKPDEVEALVKQTANEFGGFEILVNNSGGPPSGLFSEMTDEDWQKSFELNLLSYIRVIRASLPYLRKDGGKIINIASSAIKEPLPGLILSNTFRTAVVGLAKTLSVELAPDIMINTLAPGRIATDRLAQLDAITAGKQGITIEEVEKQVSAKIPMKRYGHPEEFAKFAAFLLSDANSYITGQAFLVDGGNVRSI